MKAHFETKYLSAAPKPEKLLLHDGTCFTRTPAGAYGGDPTPGQVGEIQGQISDNAHVGLVRVRKVGGLPEFDIDYFLRET